MFRHCVSQDRNRYIHGQYDLDLTFITPKLVAAGCPAFGGEQCARNSHSQMEALFDERFGQNYFVFNLCIEQKRQYDGLFGGRIFNYPFPDHYAPPLELIIELVRKVAEITAKNPAAAIIVHCKAGKGRTGVMVCAIQLYLAVIAGIQMSADEVINSFEAVRGRGLRLPCQVRAVQTFMDYVQKLRGQLTNLLTVSTSVAQILVQSYKYQQLSIMIVCSKGLFDVTEAKRLSKFTAFGEPNNAARAKKYEIALQTGRPAAVHIELFGNVYVELSYKKKVVGRIQFFNGMTKTEFREEDIDKNKGILSVVMRGQRGAILE